MKKKYTFSEELLMWKRIAVIGVLVGIIIALAVTLRFSLLKNYSRDHTLQNLTEQIGTIGRQVDVLGTRYADRVTVTNYNSTPEQTDSTPQITAINTRCREGIAAVSRDLLAKGWVFGTMIWVEEYGVFTIEDVMATRHQKSIDIWQPGRSKPHRQDNVLAVVIR